MAKMHIASIDVENIPSTNTIWKPSRNQQGRPYMYKPKPIRDWQKLVKDKLKNSDLKGLDKYEYDWVALNINFFLFNKRYKVGDLDNMLKVIIDAIFPSVTGMDDSVIVNISAMKHKTDKQIQHVEIQVLGLMDDELDTDEVDFSAND